jgi:hypothetical protein
MIENLQITIYNSGLFREAVSKPYFGTPERQTPISDIQAVSHRANLQGQEEHAIFFSTTHMVSGTKVATPY